MKKTIKYFLFIFLISSILIPVDMASASSTKPYIIILEKNVSIGVGSKKRLTASSNIKSPTIKWVSSNPSVVSIDKHGVIFGKKAGKATISAKNTKMATTNVVVKAKVVNISKIKTSKKDIKLKVGEFVHIKATIEPSNASSKKLIWSSSNSKTVSVGKDGTIYANKAGNATITVASENKKVKSVISVRVDGATPSVKSIIKEVSKSVVYIEAYDQSGTAISSGSGFIISKDGRIATNFHVVTDDVNSIKSVKIKLVDGHTYSSSNVVGYDKKNDLAIIKVDHVNNLKPVSLGDSDHIDVGDQIITIGSPLGLDNTVSEGIISNKKRVLEGVQYIQISAPISHGSSGGVLLNEKGKVIGITSAGIDEGQNLNFAIPINKLKVIKTGKPKTILSLQPKPSTGEDLLSGEQDITEIEPNDSLAQSMIIKNKDFLIQGAIADQNDLDCYKFTITSPKDVFILGSMESAYSYLTSELVFGILDSNGQVVSTSTDYTGSDGTSYREIEGTLQPGTYYLVVFGNTDSVTDAWSLSPMYVVGGSFN